MNASVVLANNPNNPFTAFLVNPSGEAQGFTNNELPASWPVGSQTNTLGGQMHVLSPAPGSWTLVVAFAPQVSGTALTEPFTVSTNDSSVPASSGGLPNSTGTKLAKGQAQTYNVRITNNGSTPDEYFVDARLPGSTPLSLSSLFGPNTTVPLNFGENVPVYLVPSHTTAFTGVAGTTGRDADSVRLGLDFGDPDIISSVGSTVSGSLSANPVAQGLWDIAPNVVGPFGATGAPSEPVQTTMNVATAPFDSAVSSQTGDLWLASTDPSQLDSLSPVVRGTGSDRDDPGHDHAERALRDAGIRDAVHRRHKPARVPGLPSGSTATTSRRSRTATRSSKWFGCRPVRGAAAITSVGEALR